MASILEQLLLKTVPQHRVKGRVVRFGQEEPDIQLATGTMPERILAYLKRNQCPATAKEIVQGIASNNSRVTRILQTLIKEQKIKCIKIEGCVTEYELI
ncbi:hypothetical protein ICHIJ1_14550 [Fluviibacter phosphoraccumulans]|uniref:hypothetical protein n=1 Tax=Fluviibacter phosphoraccumulans TaxID=1751046 RepID=UPI0013672EBC|nr:hypothetical protein [Fluviibacter phosphoraccumulans]BBU71536.1 hypothetical protein ICHIJ1_14550 [Fluviibacter phosphoraccumulans]